MVQWINRYNPYIIYRILLYGITALVTNYVPSYKENSQTRLKLEIESGLYDSTGNLILNTLEDSKDSYDSKRHVFQSNRWFLF